MARLRLLNYGNEPGVQIMEISQTGSSQQKKPLRVTNVIAHGPGIKLLNGLAKANTNGVHDLHLPLPCALFYNWPRAGLDQF
jgi:hypothetical protein